jgi:hypothetical protein
VQHFRPKDKAPSERKFDRSGSDEANSKKGNPSRTKRGPAISRSTQLSLGQKKMRNLCLDSLAIPAKKFRRFCSEGLSNTVADLRADEWRKLAQL